MPPVLTFESKQGAFLMDVLGFPGKIKYILAIYPGIQYNKMIDFNNSYEEGLLCI